MTASASRQPVAAPSGEEAAPGTPSTSGGKRVWLVRLGKNGEFEARAVDEGVLTIGFGIEHDISHLKDRDALLVEMARLFPDSGTNRHRNFAAQVNQFVNVAETGELVVCPMKLTSTIWLGRFAGPYRMGPKGEVTRPVEWLKQDLPRDTFHQDLLYSFGAFMTVCEISRNNALHRVEAVIASGVDPGDGATAALPKRAAQSREPATTEAADQPVDLVRVARDQIEKRIASVLVGHDFTRLVAAILAAQGYKATVSPPGADNGIDIVVGSGPLGLASPRLVVQVKSGNVVVDQPTLQALIGSVHDTRADNGLLVSWGGYTTPVRRRVSELYFQVRLWGRDELIDHLLATYDRLPEDIRAELPLMRTWTLVLDEEAGT